MLTVDDRRAVLTIQDLDLDDPWRLIFTAKNLKGGDPALPWPTLVCMRCGQAKHLIEFARVVGHVVMQRFRCLACKPHEPTRMPLGDDGRLQLRMEPFRDERGNAVMVLMLWERAGRAEMARVGTERFQFRKMTGVPDVRLQPYPEREGRAEWAAKDKSPAAARARVPR